MCLSQKTNLLKNFIILTAYSKKILFRNTTTLMIYKEDRNRFCLVLIFKTHKKCKEESDFSLSSRNAGNNTAIPTETINLRKCKTKPLFVRCDTSEIID